VIQRYAPRRSNIAHVMSTPNFDTVRTLCDVLAEFSWVYEFKVTQIFIEQVWKNFSSEVSNEQTGYFLLLFYGPYFI
jgi:hypothetical protein